MTTIPTGTVIRAAKDNPNVYTQCDTSSALARAYVKFPESKSDRVYRQWLEGEDIGIVIGSAKLDPRGTLMYPVGTQSWEWKSGFPVGKYQSVQYDYWVVAGEIGTDWNAVGFIEDIPPIADTPSQPTPTAAPTTSPTPPNAQPNSGAILDSVVKSLSPAKTTTTSSDSQPQQNSAVWWYVGGGVVVAAIIALILVKR